MAMAEERYNRRNPAVKRILQEVKEMQSNPSDDFMTAEDLPNQESDQRAIEDGHEVHVNAAEGPLRVGISAGASSRLPAVEVGELHQRPAARVQKPLDDRFLTWAAIWLVVAILLLLVKKFLKFNSFAGYMGGL
ncbi:hypothetical protein GW17_00005630 [Ensete ventricosum]|uniref:Uncharacterized protein n=1 Tax=Ensete ventricosum TaxID=4639 RepID=A0A444G4Q1_ENSVE|nr:hypothetical protein GW17_00005630 [Ensete ventricosum]RZR71126.1 hypothetical protein BHM03_00003714 [Ensete ventricosum]